MGGRNDNRREQYLEKPLPSSDEAERVILGAVLIDNRVFEQAAESLTAEDFYSPLNRRVFGAMLELSKAGQPIDPILIGEILKRGGSIDSIGGITTITNLAFGLPHYPNIAQYVRTVREKARIRELIRTCNKIVGDALAEEETAEAVFMIAQTEINDLCLRAEVGGAEGRFIPLEKIITTDITRILNNLREGRNEKIKTGFDIIDATIGGGISLSDVLLLVADTGAGKSALALQIAYQIANQGIPTAFLAGEMTNAENVNRLLSQVSGMVNLNWLTHITAGEHDFLAKWAEAIKNVPLFFDHKTCDLQTLGTHLRSLVRRSGVKVLVIDYIQLLKVDRVEKRKRNERIAEASQEVKRIANELGIAIIEVAQFNREGAKAMKATLHDLEGSGQLEKDASLIFILELEGSELRDSDNRKYRPAKIRIVKGRNAGPSEIDGRFFGQSVRFDF